MHESLIQALRFCASGEKFPRVCTDACPLYCAKDNAKTCTACIDNVLRQAADELEKAEERRHGKWTYKPYGTIWFGRGDPPEYVCSVCEDRSDDTSPFCPNCGARMDAKEDNAP